MAGTPAYLPLLVGMGMTDLSMNPPAILEAKKIVRNTVYKHWHSVARTILDLDSGEEINRFIALRMIGLTLQSQDDRTS
jgi:phosphoenolpyruvate-protein kinase (PTS system EI component)